MKFQENVPLKKYTTFKIGGPARYFFIVKNEASLIGAIRRARGLNLPIFILGGGSNLLVSSKGFNGLVVKIENCKLKIKNSKIFAEAGTALSQLVNFALKNSLSGAEWIAGIPGTVGGAIFGNAGAFGKSMGDIVKTVTVLEIKKNAGRAPQIRILRNAQCKFGYRNSIFKHDKNLIILSAEIRLKRGDKHEIRKEMRGYLDYRAAYHPKTPSAGSVFTNPKGYSARELIDICGLKGKKIGRAQTSDIHSNFIVNLGGAKSQDVSKLVDSIKKIVKKKFKIGLKEEIIRLK